MQKASKANSITVRQKLILYIILVVIILLLALVSTIMVQGKSPQQKCASIILEQNKISCFTNLAVSTNNASICSNLNGSYAASCYEAVAYNSGNSNICKEALASYMPVGIDCIEHFVNLTGNSILCNLLSGQNFQNCFFDAALSSGNISLCSFAGANESLCISSVSLSNALKYKNIFLCKYVSPSANASTVHSILSNSRTKINETLMGYGFSLLSYGYNISARDLCIINVADELENKSYCASLNSSIAGQLCYQFVAPPPVPKQVNYTALLNSCSNAGSFAGVCRASVLISEAINTKNPSLCNELNQTLSWDCFTTLARTYDNVSYCGYIKNATVNNACILTVRYNSTNPVP